jgi:V/A-type H+-transporting ATPase subunit I
VIITMEKVRILGPRERLDEVLDALQDLEVLHLDEPEGSDLLRTGRSRDDQDREQRHLRSVLDDVEWVLQRTGSGDEEVRERRGSGGQATTSDFARWARLARRTRRELARIRGRADELEGELDRIRRLRGLVDVFDQLAPEASSLEGIRSFHLVLPSGDPADLEELKRLLNGMVEAFELSSSRLEGGELAVILLVPAGEADAEERIEGLLAEAGIEEMLVPSEYDAESLAGATPEMEARRDELAAALEEVREEGRRLARARGPELEEALVEIRDRLLELDALSRIGETERAFVVEGWVPETASDDLHREIERSFGGEVVAERIAREEWSAEEAPVVLSNPRLFRPFETLVRLFPLPTYGSIDPTPYVAVFFPMFFGVILGDVGYGLVLAGISGLLHRRAETGSTLRAVSEIGGACAAFTVAFGLVYGELFGDLGSRWIGMEGAFHREEALLPFLVFAVGLGLVHVLLGLVLGAVSSFRSDRKESVGRGVSAVMIVLVVVAILAATEVLPARLFTPAVIALLVAFPVLVVIEGILAPVEFLSTLGNVLSYARIMALGTASVVMAVAANRLAGTLGGAAVGVLFGLLFHLVNFALGVFGPAVHGLRLQYVEFFGKFYSPGGVRYRPFGHWRPTEDEESPRAVPNHNTP